MIKNNTTDEVSVEKVKKVKKEKVVVPPKLDTLMDRILNESANPPLIGDLVEGPVINIEKSAVYIDLAPFGTGIIMGREYITARDIIKKVNIGDVVAAKVVDTNNKDGYIELSLKEARQALIWSEAEAAINNKSILELPIIEANKGGLIIQWQGISGFLPLFRPARQRRLARRRLTLRRRHAGRPRRPALQSTQPPQRHRRWIFVCFGFNFHDRRFSLTTDASDPATRRRLDGGENGRRRIAPKRDRIAGLPAQPRCLRSSRIGWCRTCR